LPRVTFVNASFVYPRSTGCWEFLLSKGPNAVFMFVVRRGSLWQKVQPNVWGATLPYSCRIVGSVRVETLMKLVLLSARAAFSVWQS